MSNLDYLAPHEVMFSFYKLDGEGYILLAGHEGHMEKLWARMCENMSLIDELKQVVEKRDMN